VGNLSTESRYWGYPEANTNVRPSYYVPTTIGTSDLTGSMSAAFAAASLAFQNVDKAYAQVRLALLSAMSLGSLAAVSEYALCAQQQLQASC
jgi:Glycosyl hydrolase family 9